MGLRERFFSTYIEIEIDDVMLMTHEFGIFECFLWMTLLTLVKEKKAKNSLTVFFLPIKKIKDF